MLNEFTNIIETGDINAMISFLKNLPESQRKELLPEIKKINNILEKQNDVRNKMMALNLAKFVCYSPAQIKALRWWDFPEVQHCNQILAWYCPSWFSNYINSLNGFIRHTYQDIIQWQALGYLDPTPELVARLLPNAIVMHGHGQGQYVITTLEIYPVTLDQHIWWLFEYPSSIDWCDKMNLKGKDEKSKGWWCDTFAHYISTGRIDRMRMLRECLLTANRNFNKTQTGWFTHLFLALEPSDKELITLQDDLLATLTCVQTKPVNTTLNLLKKLCSDQSFKTDVFLDQVPLLLSSETKSLSLTTIAILETLLKSKINNTETVCRVLCSAFISKDEAIQKKTAQLIARYATPSPELNADLQVYAHQLLMSVRPILDKYIVIENTITPHEVLEKQYLITPDKTIDSPATWEDYIYFLSQAQSAGEGFYLDQVLATLLHFAKEVNIENVHHFEPILQRACKQLKNFWEQSSSELIVNNLLFHYGHHLIKQYPQALIAVSKMFAKFITEDELAKKSRKVEWYSPANYWSCYVEVDKIEYPTAIQGYRPLVMAVYKTLLGIENNLPLLSTPTHQPCWIDPITLVNRLVQYQTADIEPLDMDMQLALQRCALDHTNAAQDLTKQQLKGELHDLLLFFLDPHAQLPYTGAHRAWWITASIVRSSKTAFEALQRLEYTHIKKEFLTGEHVWEIKLHPENKYQPVSLEIASRTTSDIANTLWIEQIINNPHKAPSYISQGFELSLLATPNNIDSVLAQIIQQCMRYAGIYEVYEKGMVTRTIQLLHQLDIIYRPTTHLFIALSMLNADKTIRQYAAEIWIQKATSGKVNSRLLGKKIGRIEKYEWSPLKRLNDIIADNMMGISTQHNKLLQELIEALLIELDAPITQVKNLLTLYGELLAQQQSVPSEATKAKLSGWVGNANIKKICTQLIKN